MKHSGTVDDSSEKLMIRVMIEEDMYMICQICKRWFLTVKTKKYTILIRDLSLIYSNIRKFITRARSRMIKSKIWPLL